MEFTLTLEFTFSSQQEMKPYIDSTNKLRQNAILLYPYILDKTISHGRAAEILGMSKLDLFDLYANIGFPYFDLL